jgi:hypothetical protein
MARSPSLSPEEARHRADQRFAKSKQRDEDARTAHAERNKIQQAEADKTARLRALRLAKEAADVEAASRAAAAKAAEPAAKRKPARSAEPAKSPAFAKP